MKPKDLEQIDALIARRLAASAPEPATTRRVNGRKVDAHATVVDGMVYDLKPRRWLNAIGWIVTIVILAALAWLILPGLLSAPQTTVDTPPTIAPTMPARPTREPAAAPAQDAPAAPAVPVVLVMPAPTDTPAWVGGGGDQLAPQAQDIPTPEPAWHAPMSPDYSVCAAWHAPLPWPAECGEQDSGWHAPMAKP